MRKHYMIERTGKTDTRGRILSAAMDLFAAHGFHGTTVDAIVQAAEVNKRMVYHYFGSKEKLYKAALVEIYKRLSLLEVETFRHSDDIEENFREIVALYFDFLRANPDFTRLVLWENLNEGRGLKSARPQLTKNPVLHLLDRALKRAKAKGVVRREIHARHLLIHLIALCQIYTSNRHTLSQALGMDLGSPRVLREGKKQAIDLLLNGIMA
ncbi:MAG: TetR/AcrR family transcriptional regulator [Opitutaceae bacterium]